METQQVFVGIDISKDRLDTFIRPQETFFSEPYTEQGVRALVKRVTELSPQLVLLEATGGYEAQIVAALAHAKLPVVLINPRQVRDFAKAMGKLAKTDHIDARVLARFAEAVRPEPRLLPDQDQKELASLMSRHCQIVEMIVMEKNRTHTTTKIVKDRILAHLNWLQTELKDVDRQLDDFIRKNPTFQRNIEIVRSVPGIGPALSRALISYLPELGTINRKEIAALAGVAPFNSDSGKHTGKRIIWGGRKQLRNILYMGALVGSRYNPVIREFYQRLRAAGKLPKVALTACMRKLLTIVNAMVRSNTLWNANYHV
jgi:transposase